MLKGVVIKQSKKIEMLENEVEDVKSRMMRENIMIHNVPETQNVSVEKLARDALHLAGYDIKDTEFDRIHRVGQSRNNNKPRPIVAKPSRFKDVSRLLAKRVTKQQKATGAWISPQYTEKVRETRQQLGEMASAWRKKHPQSDVKLKFTTLTINGERVKPSLKPPDVATLLTMDEIEKFDLESRSFTSSATVSELGSTFVAQCIPVGSLNDVKEAYKALHLDCTALSATHNIAAYILPNKTRGYSDDGDYGLGRTIIRAMDSSGDHGVGKAVFVTRQYGGTKLGFRRFDIVYELVVDCIKKHHEEQGDVTYFVKGKPSTLSASSHITKQQTPKKVKGPAPLPPTSHTPQKSEACRPLSVPSSSSSTPGAMEVNGHSSRGQTSHNMSRESTV